MRNYRVDVLEEGDAVIFLHRVVRGGADRSYGIHVAQLAGMPNSVVRRAREILQDLEEGAPGKAERIASPQDDRRSARSAACSSPSSARLTRWSRI